MTGNSTLLFDLQDNDIIIAIQTYFLNELLVSELFNLVTQFLPGA